MPQEITQILHEWKKGDDTAVERLFPFVYEELKRRARTYLRGERDNHTLQPTALVHEAYMRLVDVDSVDWQDRVHFYAIASNVMRRILVDHARALKRKKRGGGDYKIPLSEIQVGAKGEAAELLNLDEALNNLEKLDERKSKVVEMSYFGGMNQKEIASALGISEKTVQRDWRFAKLWLYRALTNSE